MATTFKLQPLVDLAAQQNDAATKKFGQLNQQQQAAQAKLEMLQQYRRDYQERFQNAVQNGMDQTDMRNFQDFLYRLDEAIRQQRALLEQIKVAVQSGRTELMEAQRKVKSFDTLAQRHQEAEKAKENKLEQRAQDEFNGRLAAYRMMQQNQE
ncbi:MAG: flagellar export protein FliJ [Pseudomonadota bacterium]